MSSSSTKKKGTEMEHTPPEAARDAAEAIVRVGERLGYSEFDLTQGAPGCPCCSQDEIIADLRRAYAAVLMGPTS